MEDIFSIIEKIFPVLIFIFWIIVTIIAGSRKNKQRRQQASSQTTMPSQSQREPNTASDRYRTGNEKTRPVDELKKKLESIFGEITLEGDQVENEEAVIQGIPHTPETTFEKTTVESVPFPARYKPALKMPDATLLASIYEEAPHDIDKSYFTAGISVSELRKAVIWSEIIAPPIALRRND